jgi:alpha-glucuronidase
VLLLEKYKLDNMHYMNRLTYLSFIFLCLITGSATGTQSGYDLWMRYVPVENIQLRESYHQQLQNIAVTGDSETTQAIVDELKRGLRGLLKADCNIQPAFVNQQVLIGTPNNSPEIAALNIHDQLNELGNEGYVITYQNVKGKSTLIVASNGEIGTLYGTFHLLRLVQTQQQLSGIKISERPITTHRLLNHWDNLDRTVERGYAGFSIWDWHKLPDYIDPRYIDYARANASIGINGTVVSNVNANALILTPQYLNKLNGLAKVFRPYGIKVYLTARFSAPIEIGGLPTADPLNADVQQWWKKKVDEIYAIIPDFGGFLVKANSEGQPGPQDYKRTHADGANMLARAAGSPWWSSDVACFCI